ncbi:uncharacterized protein [Cicer arietinum]|uniref:Uncharacterized protein LOC101500424 n=1 Tax=Cicer arietinum TaxID=3827 RepID=A0A1S2Z586_CICAR|nr:uncharacterized protein LOC101500424 [Cicer arietinum]
MAKEYMCDLKAGSGVGGEMQKGGDHETGLPEQRHDGHRITGCPERTRIYVMPVRNQTILQKIVDNKDIVNYKDVACPIARGPVYHISGEEAPSSSELILGMDWLSSNYFMIDCAQRNVIFIDPDTLKFLSTNRLRFSHKGGVQKNVFLNSINLTPEVVVDENPMVKDFSEVFPPNVLGLPPVYNVKFSINFISGTGSISISPYKMAPLELLELKNQLEYLMSKKFIRPSVSP